MIRVDDSHWILGIYYENDNGEKQKRVDFRVNERKNFLILNKDLVERNLKDDVKEMCFDLKKIRFTDNQVDIKEGDILSLSNFFFPERDIKRL